MSGSIMNTIGGFMKQVGNIANQFDSSDFPQEATSMGNQILKATGATSYVHIIRSTTAFAILTAITTIAAIVFSFLLPALVLPAIIAATVFGIITMGLSIPLTQKVNQAAKLAGKFGLNV